MRDYREFDGLDLKLNLLRGKEIRVDNLFVPPYTLEEILEYGHSDYMMNIQILLITVDDFIASVVDLEKKLMLEVEKSNLRAFDFYMNLGGSELRDELMNALAMIFKTDDIRIIDNEVIALDFVTIGIMKEGEDGRMVVDQDILDVLDEDAVKVIHRNNFDDLVKVVKLQNCLSKPDGDLKRGANPADDETRELMEFMDKMNEKVNKKKKAQQQHDNDGDIDIHDIISAVSSKSNSINKLNVWDLTIYQLYDEYSRLELIDNYDFSIRAMMAGAEKIDLKHWSSKI